MIADIFFSFVVAPWNFSYVELKFESFDCHIVL